MRNLVFFGLFIRFPVDGAFCICGFGGIIIEGLDSVGFAFVSCHLCESVINFVVYLFFPLADACCGLL